MIFGPIVKAFTWARTVVPEEKRNVFVVFGIILSASALDNLNSSSSLTLAADIQKRFNTDSSTATWVLSGYALTLGSFIMISGKISDIIGSHNLFLIGLGVFWVSALICALIPNTSIVALIVFRAIQGIGASSLIPSTIAMAANYFSGPLAKYLNGMIVCSILALTATIGLGVVLGGAFSESKIGYKGFFYFVFAYSLVCHIALIFLIIPIKKTESHNKLKMKNIDFVAAFLVIAGCLLMILGLTEGGDNWKSPKAIAPLIVGFFTFLSALAYEYFYIKKYQIKHDNEDKSTNWRLQVDLLFPPEISKIPNVYSFLTIRGTYFATTIMLTAIGVQTFTLIDHEPPIVAAVKAFPLSIGLVFGAFIYRDSYYKKVGYKNMFIISSVLSLASVIWFSRTKFDTVNSYWKYNFIPYFMFGYSINIFFNIYMPLVVQSTPLHLQGVVNGIFQTSSQVLLSVGNALVPSITGNLEKAYTFEEKTYIQKKFRAVLYVMIGFHAFVVLLMVFAIKDTTKSIQPEREEKEIGDEKIDEKVDLEKQPEATEKSESSVDSYNLNKKTST